MSDLLNYNLIIRLEELSMRLPRIVEHVERHGVTWPGLPNINETPVRLGTKLYTAATASKVRMMFAEDFDQFGYSTQIPSSCEEATLPDADLLRAIQQRNRRIFLLSLKQRGML